LADAGVPVSLDLVAAASGSLALETGIYRAALDVKDGGGGYARRGAVVHIYPNLASGLSLSFGEAPFSAPFFTDTQALSSWLEGSPQNDAEDSYPISLSLDLADLAEGGDGLGGLFAALHGRYIALDLSACRGTAIVGQALDVSRPNADRLVSLILPAGLERIGPGAFAGCASLASVIPPEPVPPTLEDAAVFSNCSPSLFFYVNEERGELRYMNAPGWKDYGGRIKAAFRAGGVGFAMTYVPGGVRFPLGLDDSGTYTGGPTIGDGNPAVVPDPYMISETEVTWELWTAVRDWALGEGYAIEDASPNYAAPNNPIMNSWYNCAVWCNALTEWYNEKTGASLVPVYYDDNSFTDVSKDSDPHQGQQETEMPYKTKPGASGFRLPTYHEWELAARWRWDSANTAPGYENPWFTRGDSASGATADYTNTAETARVAVWGGNLEQVKSRAPNALGLYDMSGNVFEWVNDYWFYAKGNIQNCAIQVLERGGCWFFDVSYMAIGKPYYYEADGKTVDGIRLVCSAVR
jgi:formylglycine-generating enzyme required for sulfatase activity